MSQGNELQYCLGTRALWNGYCSPLGFIQESFVMQVYERMQEINAASAEARASKILHGLGFTKVMQARQTNLFSGGWRMRISLARALYIQPTVLLLDEPTNHLDLRAVLWLEEYLTRWKKTLIVVSHDRDFLNTVTTDIIHLHDLKLHFYRGNFAQFEEMYEQKRREVNKAAEKYEKQIKAAKKTGSKAAQDKVRFPPHLLLIYCLLPCHLFPSNAAVIEVTLRVSPRSIKVYNVTNQHLLQH